MKEEKSSGTLHFPLSAHRMSTAVLLFFPEEMPALAAVIADGKTERVGKAESVKMVRVFGLVLVWFALGVWLFGVLVWF